MVPISVRVGELPYYSVVLFSNVALQVEFKGHYHFSFHNHQAGIAGINLHGY